MEGKFSWYLQTHMNKNKSPEYAKNNKDRSKQHQQMS